MIRVGVGNHGDLARSRPTRSEVRLLVAWEYRPGTQASVKQQEDGDYPHSSRFFVRTEHKRWEVRERRMNMALAQ